MLSGVCLGTNNLTTAGVFYDTVLATIGMSCVVFDEKERGYAGIDGKVTFFLIVPFNKQEATFGNGTQVMFHAQDIEAVNKFHAAVLDNGGTDEGQPGPRDYYANYYGAYVRDLDGNKLNISVNIAKN